MIQILILHLCLFLSAFAGDISSLLPPEDEITPWQPTEPPTVYVGRQLFDYIDGGADIYLEYGFKQVLSQEYANSDDIIGVDIFEMTSPEAAFGIYSCNRNYGYPSLDVGDDGLIAEYQVSFWQDRYYVVVMGYKSDEASHRVLKRFAHHVSIKISKHAKPPQILCLLPEEGKIHRSECYIKGTLALNSRHYFSQKDIFEFDSGHVQAAFAEYSFDDGDAELLLVCYQDSTQAKRVMQTLVQHYKQKYVGVEETGKVLLATDKQNRFFSLAGRDNVIAAILKASKRNICLELSLSALNLLKK